MIDKQSIILGYYQLGKSKKQLSRDLGISLKTVKKYLTKHEQEMSRAGHDSSKLPVEGIIHPPGYDSSNRIKRVLTQEVSAVIDEYLAQNKIKRDQGRHKQLMKKIDIFQVLERAGHRISYTSVCRYVRRQTAQSKEVFIRQQYAPGQAVEFDWGAVKISIEGLPKTLMMAVFTSCNSNHRWARLYHRQDMSSFVDTHSQYFACTGGVQKQVVYDNMRVAVKKYTIRNSDKEPTEALLKMSCYYKFDYRFCNAGKGNEKGRVERSVEYIRRKAFASKDSFESLEAANTYLLQCCERLNQQPLTGQSTPIRVVFEEELRHMRTAPPAYDASELTCLRVDKYSCIKVDTNWYSVAEGQVGSMLNVKVYPDKILVYSPDNQIIAAHVRRHTRFKYFLKIDHYLKTLRIKPGALAGSLTLQQADLRLRHIFCTYFNESPRVFVETLLYLRQKNYSIPHLQQALDQCLKLCPHQAVSLDKIKILLLPKQQNDSVQITPQDPFSKQIVQHSTAQLKSIQSLVFSQQ